GFSFFAANSQCRGTENQFLPYVTSLISFDHQKSLPACSYLRIFVSNLIPRIHPTPLKSLQHVHAYFPRMDRKRLLLILLSLQNPLNLSDLSLQRPVLS